ncbi:hypothetical protein WL32_06745 [Burkholderia cepacia]|nr:hypothetical protein WL32_06745 [Burkholderia cepacia]
MLAEHLPGVVPTSLLGKALQMSVYRSGSQRCLLRLESVAASSYGYMSGQWHKLVRYVGNGNWMISNNLCENAIRPFAVGRKVWLYSHTVAGAQASANLYSLVETCKANGVEPIGISFGCSPGCRSLQSPTTTPILCLGEYRLPSTAEGRR